MKKTAIAAAVALAVGVGIASTASAGTAGLTGAGSGTYTFTMFDGSGGTVGGSSGSPWSFDFDAGTASITNTAPFFGLPWTAKNVTFADNGDGTYSGNMLFDWGVNANIPVTIDWDITTGAVTTLDGDGDGILGNAMTAGPFVGFSPVFDGPLTGQVAPGGGPGPVPIPAAAWLFGSGLVGLVGVARRRRRAS